MFGILCVQLWLSYGFEKEYIFDTDCGIQAASCKHLNWLLELCVTSTASALTESSQINGPSLMIKILLIFESCHTPVPFTSPESLPTIRPSATTLQVSCAVLTVWKPSGLMKESLVLFCQKFQSCSTGSIFLKKGLRWFQFFYIYISSASYILINL